MKGLKVSQAGGGLTWLAEQVVGRAGYGGQRRQQVPGAGSLPPDFPNQLLSLPAAEPHTPSFPEDAFVLHASFSSYPDQVSVYLQATRTLHP